MKLLSLKNINFNIKYNLKARNKIYLFDNIKPKSVFNIDNIPTSFDWSYCLKENQIYVYFTLSL